jgi:hypothetical protein
MNRMVRPRIGLRPSGVTKEVMSLNLQRRFSPINTVFKTYPQDDST